MKKHASLQVVAGGERYVIEQTLVRRVLERVAQVADLWFRRYWTFGVGSGAHILVARVLIRGRGPHQAAEHRPLALGLDRQPVDRFA